MKTQTLIRGIAVAAVVAIVLSTLLPVISAFQ